jgi:hypothetical protein
LLKGLIFYNSFNRQPSLIPLKRKKGDLESKTGLSKTDLIFTRALTIDPCSKPRRKEGRGCEGRREDVML